MSDVDRESRSLINNGEKLKLINEHGCMDAVISINAFRDVFLVRRLIIFYFIFCMKCDNRRTQYNNLHCEEFSVRKMADQIILRVVV